MHIAATDMAAAAVNNLNILIIYITLSRIEHDSNVKWPVRSGKTPRELKRGALR
jgi:hypothetical protein